MNIRLEGNLTKISNRWVWILRKLPENRDAPLHFTKLINFSIRFQGFIKPLFSRFWNRKLNIIRVSDVLRKDSSCAPYVDGPKPGEGKWSSCCRRPQMSGSYVIIWRLQFPFNLYRRNIISKAEISKRKADFCSASSSTLNF